MTDPSSAWQIPDAALRAAEAGDAGELLTYLYRSGAIDGVTRILQRKYYGKLDHAQVADCIAEGAEATFEAFRKGGIVRHPVAYLLKVASSCAADAVASDEFRGRTDVDVESLADSPWIPDRGSESVRDEAMAKALVAARSYLPRLGQANVQKVVSVLLDAVENHVLDLPASRIAELTGLTTETARRLVNRGLQRLPHFQFACIGLSPFQRTPSSLEIVEYERIRRR